MTKFKIGGYSPTWEGGKALRLVSTKRLPKGGLRRITESEVILP